MINSNSTNTNHNDTSTNICNNIKHNDNINSSN